LLSFFSTASASTLSDHFNSASGAMQRLPVACKPNLGKRAVAFQHQQSDCNEILSQRMGQQRSMWSSRSSWSRGVGLMFIFQFDSEVADCKLDVRMITRK
jgi:hypothetical protein